MNDPTVAPEELLEFVNEANRHAFDVSEPAPYTFRIIPGNPFTITTLAHLARDRALTGGMPMAIGMLVTAAVVLGSCNHWPEEMLCVDVDPGPPCTITINDPVLRGHLDDDPLRGNRPRAKLLEAVLKSGLALWRLDPDHDLGGHVVATTPVSRSN